MSLNGNLEDLPLLDILQIVSFSKKTGYLAIQAEQGEGAIVFRDGFVVASFTWDSLPMDPRAASLPEARRSEVIRNRIGVALEQLIRLREGQFSFNLTDDIPPSVSGRDIKLETLVSGINPQELLLDLARGIDEDRRDSSAALEASFAQPTEDIETIEPDSVVLVEEDDKDRAREGVEGEQDEGVAPLTLEPISDDFSATIPIPVLTMKSPETKAPEAQKAQAPKGPTPPEPGEQRLAQKTILLVDDEEEVRRVLAGLFTLVGYEVFQADEVTSAVKEAQKLQKDGKSFLLITDLGMPTSGGSSFQGGFEVVKRLWKMKMRPPVLMMTESLSPALQARAKQMGVSSFVFKPSLSKLDSKQFEADLRAFATKLVQDVLPKMGRTQEVRQKQKTPALAPAAPSPPRPETPPPSAEDLSRDFSMLQQHLDELRSHADATQISSLVMRVGREFFERAILFLVKNDEIRGLGGFGHAPKGQKISFLAREVVISLNDPSVFRDVVTKRKPFYGALPEGRWSRHLTARIGRFQSNEVCLMPLLSHREAVAVLYGDNPETGHALGRLDGLEVFINQAGIALENAFLQKKLQTLQAQP